MKNDEERDKDVMLKAGYSFVGALMLLISFTLIWVWFSWKLVICIILAFWGKSLIDAYEMRDKFGKDLYND